ncbi:MAG: hypothetical protein ACRBC3_08760 [Burkholderiaceae bacterium]
MNKHAFSNDSDRRLGKSIVGMIAAALLGGALSTPVLAQTTYPMICRAGGEMKVTIGLYTFDQLQDSRTYFRTRFVRSPRAYSPWTLLPGQCAWRDRGVSASEPNQLNFYTNSRVFLEFPAYGVGYVSATVSASTSNPEVVRTQNMIALIKGRGLFTLSVRPHARDYMVIERIRPGT